MHFADATHGWAVGDKGTILATADGGATWQKRDSGTSNDLYGVHFADATHGWAAGDKGTILATADGGATWQKRDSGTSNDLYGVHFADATHGWAAGDNGTILATADGGATWQKRDSGTSNRLVGVHFADATHGWAVGNEGTIIIIAGPDVRAVTTAEHVASMQAALKLIDVSEGSIGQPLIDFKNVDADFGERSKRVEQDQQELATYAPKQTTEATTASLLNNPMFLSNLNRAGITIYAFFAVTIIVAVYRYSMRLSAHYDACADALELSDGSVDARFHQLVRTLSPASIDFGKVPRSPVDQALETLQGALRSGRRP